jgi:hypothetical protein
MFDDDPAMMMRVALLDDDRLSRNGGSDRRGRGCDRNDQHKLLQHSYLRYWPAKLWPASRHGDWSACPMTFCSAPRRPFTRGNGGTDPCQERLERHRVGAFDIGGRHLANLAPLRAADRLGLEEMVSKRADSTNRIGPTRGWTGSKCSTVGPYPGVSARRQASRSLCRPPRKEAGICRQRNDRARRQRA